MLEHDPAASPAAEPDVEAASSAVADVPAESSPAATEKEAPTSLLDVMRDVLEPKEEAAEGSSPAAAEQTESAPEGEGDAAKAEEPENFDGESFGRHPRFKKVLDERNTAKTRVKELEPLVQEVERLKAPAEQYERIEAFMQQHGMTGQEVVDLYKFGALMKTDPEKALEFIQPQLMNLWTRTGQILPDDLKTEVENGGITEARARELAKERARATEATRRADAATERAETVETTTTQDRQNAAFAAKLTDWEAGKKAKDPDYAAKEDLIADRCAAILASKGKPNTPDEMIAILERAHKDVTERLLKVMPAKPAIQKKPAGGAPNSASAVPTSFRHALELAANQGR